MAMLSHDQAYAAGSHWGLDGYRLAGRFLCLLSAGITTALLAALWQAIKVVPLS